eukprot:3026870-Pyramimonas_sp.AAC.1
MEQRQNNRRQNARPNSAVQAPQQRAQHDERTNNPLSKGPPFTTDVMTDAAKGNTKKQPAATINQGSNSYARTQGNSQSAPSSGRQNNNAQSTANNQNNNKKPSTGGSKETLSVGRGTVGALRMDSEALNQYERANGSGGRGAFGPG